MKKRLFTILVLLFSVMGLRADDLELISRQFVNYFTERSVSESAVAQSIQSLRDDGTWADVDYASKRRGGWPTLNHLKRVETLAVAYADNDSVFFQSLELKEAVLNGLGHWIEKDYRNPNWWQRRIGVPQTMAACMILLGDDLPKDVLKNARPILLRSKMGMTGQNKVWCAGNNVMIGLLYGEPDRITKAVSEIWSELRVSTEEGIQPDWSFHQHGPQQQFGNYGQSFAGDMIKWAMILHGTDHGLNGENLEILRNYLLDGVSWIIWNGRMDFSGCGRQIDEGAQGQKGRSSLRQLDAMTAIDPEFSDQYKSVKQRIGFKPFWRSEMGVQRRPDWYASVKMSSKRVIGSETCNSENMQGLHLGDGTLLIYQDGGEYEDIVPLWDWKRLPGTTCDQGLNTLTPKGFNRGFGESEFSGVIGDAQTGAAAMTYKRGNLSARKSWFFFEDHMVCLGAGISGETKGDVYTSIEQAWLKGSVEQYTGSILHHGIHYEVMDGKPVVEHGNVDGNWTGSFPDRADRPESGDVFSAWINHGKSPKDATYAYRILPNIGKERSGLKSEVLSNTKNLQAVTCERTVYAVFYAAGKLEIGKGRAVEASGPCLLLMSDKGLKVADPTHSLQTLEIKVNGKSHKINLPQGTGRGKQVEVKNEYAIGWKLPPDAVGTCPDSNPLRGFDAGRPDPAQKQRISGDGGFGQ